MKHILILISLVILGHCVRIKDESNNNSIDVFGLDDGEDIGEISEQQDVQSNIINKSNNQGNNSQEVFLQTHLESAIHSNNENGLYDEAQADQQNQPNQASQFNQQNQPLKENQQSSNLGDVLNNLNPANTPENDDGDNSIDKELKSYWKNLFISNERPETCQKQNDKDELAVVRPQLNPYEKKYGFGDVAYLFDVLDEFLKTDIINEFKNMFNEAKQLKAEKEYQDPFSLDKMIVELGKTHPSIGKPKTMDESKKFEIIKKYIKGFDLKIWNESITASQLVTLYKTWGWDSSPFGENFAKKIISTFDFNGDGRLNLSEFIILSIIGNKKIIGNCSKFCYKNILKIKIDPIYKFIDCDGDELLSSEEIWNGLKNLKRSDPKKYDIWACKLPNAFQKYFRTTSINDFILKNNEKKNGFVTLPEFRQGILLGYWDRYTTIDKVVDDESKSLKSKRWLKDGLEDKQCKQLMDAMMVNNADSGVNLRK